MAVTSAQPSSAPAGSSLRRIRWLVWGAALALGIFGGLLVALLRNSSGTSSESAPAQAQAVQTWVAGARAAPGFALRDDGGNPISLAQFHGRPVLLTFMDPVCTDFCPREAAILDRALTLLPTSRRPAVLVVSVNEFEQSRPILLRDRAKWKMGAGWHWATGTPALERKVWRDYGIVVVDSPTTKNGKVEHEITHTEATYVIDAHGGERALFLYPFRAADVAKTLRALD